MLLSKELVEEIRSQASISEVIGHYLPLIQKGHNYTALCPFHDDHDPSLSISEDKKIFKCFVCGKGGTVFTFVQLFKDISYPEAVQEVAKIIGKDIDLNIAKPKIEISPFQSLLDAFKEATTFTNYLLASRGGQIARDYLTKRGLDEKVISHFKIGYNPSGNLLYQYLKGKNFSDEDLLKANLVHFLSNGLVDVYSSRITFPITNLKGQAVAFTARDLTGESSAKYINTAETPIYRKGDIIYNAYEALDKIKEAGRVIVCEGVMDVIAFFRADIPFAVATLGTACSNEQLKILRKLSPNLILAYDGDRAGVKANLTLGAKAFKEGFNVSVISFANGLDPDETLLTGGKNGLRDLLGKALPYLDYLMLYYRQELNLDNYMDRKKMMLNVGSFIDLITDPYDRDNYEEQLYRYTNIHRKKLTSSIGNKLENEYNKEHIEVGINDGLTLAEYTILNMMSLSGEAINIYKQELGTLISKDCESLALLIIDDNKIHQNCDLSRIYEETSSETIKKLIIDLGVLPFCVNYRKDLFLGAINKIKVELNLRKIKYLKTQLVKSRGEEAKEKEILVEIATIAKSLGVKNEQEK